MALPQPIVFGRPGEHLSMAVVVPDSVMHFGTTAERDKECAALLHDLIDKTVAEAARRHLTIDWTTFRLEGTQDHMLHSLGFKTMTEAADTRTLSEVLPELLADANRARERAHGDG